MKKSAYRNYISCALFGTSAYLIVLLTGFRAERQQAEGYVITCKIAAEEGTHFFLSYRYEGEAVRDSSVRRMGQVVFKGILPEPVICTLSNSQNGQMRIFIAQNAKINLAGTVDKLFDLKVSNGVQDSLYRIFNAGYAKASKAFRADLAASGAKTKDHTSPAYKNYQQRVDSILKVFVGTYASSTAAALAIINTYVVNPDRKAAKAAYELLSKKGQQSFYAKRIAQFTSADARLAIGNAAPDFRLTDIHGKTCRLSDLKGKYVFLDFWASWCPPCRAEHPGLRELHKKYGDDQIQFVSVSMDSWEPAWQKAVKDDQLTWLQLNDPLAMNGPVADSYGLKSLPASFLLDKNGKIIAKHLRGSALAERIKVLLGS